MKKSNYGLINGNKSLKIPWTITASSTAADGYYSDTLNYKEPVQDSITKKQRKFIEDQVKVWMDDHLKEELQKEAGQLLKDIDNLKEEKKRLGKSISSLKQEMRKTKKEIRTEISSMENMLEKYANRILRYQNMDL